MAAAGVDAATPVTPGLLSHDQAGVGLNLHPWIARKDQTLSNSPSSTASHWPRPKGERAEILVLKQPPTPVSPQTIWSQRRRRRLDETKQATRHQHAFVAN